MRFLWRVIRELLFLTPFGYIFQFYSLLQGKEIPGMDIHIAADENDKPTYILSKPNPTLYNRVNWFVRGLFLIFQSILLGYHFLPNNFKEIGLTFGHNEKLISGSILAYILFAFDFGVMAISLTFFPRLDWNKKIGDTKISYFAALIYFSILLPISVGFIFIFKNNQFVLPF